MKQTLVAMILSISTIAVASPAEWKLVGIGGKPAKGFIYHTYAIGTNTNDIVSKVVTSLRFACSASSTDIPVVAIYWNTMDAEPFINNPEVTIETNSGRIGTLVWNKDRSLLFRSLTETLSVAEAMKKSSYIEFSWNVAPGHTRITRFDTKQFAKGLPAFYKSCNIKQ